MSPKKTVRHWHFRIEDIIKAIDNIEEYTKGQTLDTFLQDKKTCDAVIRNIEIIGEAVSHLPNDFKHQHNQIPWQIIKDFRNKLAHEYFGVDLTIIWNTIQSRLISLKPELLKIIAITQA